MPVPRTDFNKSDQQYGLKAVDIKDYLRDCGQLRWDHLLLNESKGNVSEAFVRYSVQGRREWADSRWMHAPSEEDPPLGRLPCRQTPLEAGTDI